MNNLNNNSKGGTYCMSKAGLAIGDGAKTGIALASVVGTGTDFCIDGILYNKSDSATNVALTAAAVQPVLTKCIYLVCINSSGTISTVKGVAQLTADLTAGTKVLQWPDLSTDLCAIGAVKIQCASTATFTAGTTALDATNVTATYYDLFSIPATPLTS